MKGNFINWVSFSEIMWVHNIDPVLFGIGPFEIRWYGLIYALSFVLVYLWLRRAAKKNEVALSNEDVDLFILWSVIGVIVGARLFEVLFYEPGYYFSNLWRIFAVWEGGLSFHGGLVGEIIVMLLFARKKKIRFLLLSDLVVVPAALTQAFGRIANFINGELPGRITDVVWAVKFQAYEGFRHPTQLYESAYNFLSFFILYPIRSSRLGSGMLTGMFLVLYSTLRFFVEFLKDQTEISGSLTNGLLLGLGIGQWLSIPMFAAGIWLIVMALRRHD